MKAMNMDESANGSLSVEFRHLVGLTAFLLWYTSGREIKDSLETTEGELYYCQGHTFYFCLYRKFTPRISSFHSILYPFHKIRIYIFTEMTKQILITTKKERLIMLN